MVKSNVIEFLPIINWYELFSPITMDNDLVLFFVGVGVLILYLIFSAMTEMGTKFPWKK
ncbi:hypothetical protein [Allocoleopsis sp.]|uniref:hypothetical protein n=1 Tax=Allocoleopsis sp. TaxID=3088169 RepID=UPI002FD36E7E